MRGSRLRRSNIEEGWRNDRRPIVIFWGNFWRKKNRGETRGLLRFPKNFGEIKNVNNFFIILHKLLIRTDTRPTRWKDTFFKLLNHVFDAADSRWIKAKLAFVPTFAFASNVRVCFQRLRLLPTFLEIEPAQSSTGSKSNRHAPNPMKWVFAQEFQGLKPVTTSRLTFDSFRQTPNPQGSIHNLFFLQFRFRKTHNFGCLDYRTQDYRTQPIFGIKNTVLKG